MSSETDLPEIIFLGPKADDEASIPKGQVMHVCEAKRVTAPFQVAEAHLQ